MNYLIIEKMINAISPKRTAGELIAKFLER